MKDLADPLIQTTVTSKDLQWRNISDPYTEILPQETSKGLFGESVATAVLRSSEIMLVAVGRASFPPHKFGKVRSSVNLLRCMQCY